MKKGLLVHSEVYLYRAEDLAGKKTIGREGDKPILAQPPKFKDEPLVFCSYFCPGYETAYDDQGIFFETDAKVRYAIPTDSWSLMRQGNWIPGHERFIFQSIEEMLKAYPTGLSFQKAFMKYFKTLKPEEVFPEQTKKDAEMYFEMDLYRKRSIHCNEICFSSPLQMKNARIYKSQEELSDMLHGR